MDNPAINTRDLGVLLIALPEREVESDADEGDGDMLDSKSNKKQKRGDNDLVRFILNIVVLHCHEFLLKSKIFVDTEHDTRCYTLLWQLYPFKKSPSELCDISDKLEAKCNLKAAQLLISYFIKYRHRIENYRDVRMTVELILSRVPHGQILEHIDPTLHREDIPWMEMMMSAVPKQQCSKQLIDKFNFYIPNNQYYRSRPEIRVQCTEVIERFRLLSTER